MEGASKYSTTGAFKKCTIYDVMKQHISNDKVRKRMNSYSMEQTMELRRTQWLEK
jgi:hypothetical protein